MENGIQKQICEPKMFFYWTSLFSDLSRQNQKMCACVCVCEYAKMYIIYLQSVSICSYEKLPVYTGNLNSNQTTQGTFMSFSFLYATPFSNSEKPGFNYT